MAQKMRVHILARALNVTSKVIVAKCQDEGIDIIKNHMSTLSAGLEATIREWFSEGAHETALETSARVDLEKVRVKRKKKKVADTTTSDSDENTSDSAATAVAEAPDASQTTDSDADSPEGELPSVATAPADAISDDTDSVGTMPPEPSVAASTSPDVVPADQDQPPLEQDAPASISTGEGSSREGEPASGLDVAASSDDAGSSAASPLAPTTENAPPSATESTDAPQHAVDGQMPDVAAQAPSTEEPKAPIGPVGPKHVPAPAKLQGPRVVRYEPLESDSRPLRRGPIARSRPTPGGGPPRPEGGPPPSTTESDRGTRKRGGGARGKGKGGDWAGHGPGWGDRDLAERRERLAGATGRRHRRRAAPSSGGPAQTPAGPKTEATVNEPIRMKEFCSATGLNFIQLFRVLREEHDIVGNINMTLPIETAELLALHFGIELTVIHAKTKLDEVREEFERRERTHLEIRPPVVTMLGHVDHGKTSLLDAIRSTRVASKEDGGITQHIGAHYVATANGRVTFLDTPGHEAFTAMRARGAKITDVVVLVVAADDGVMPQTNEAINHAKAADVPIVVALNKIDLGDQNKIKIYGQLAERELTPSGEWGGETDVIETSATTGTGIEELISHLSELSNLLELKADSKLPAHGVVIEAETKPGVGAVVNALIREGTLNVGDFVVCGNASGKVRALLDDQGNKIDSAGPSIPVEVWGLDDVPTAGDHLYQLKSSQRCKEVALETKRSRITENRQQSRKVKTLEEMFLQRDSEELPELNVIVKADVDGSLVALRQILGEFPSEEVRLTLRHTGVGAVNDSDVLLAAACGGLIVAFRVDAAVGPRRLAEQHGVEIRPYRVIYDVADDIKKALEGLLAPEERPEHRGTALVKEVFHLSKGKGVVAGSQISDGIVNRNQLAKVLRDGVVVREGCKFASLRRFKDDVKEVRNGMECGIRLEGFDDIHAGDTIETYEILKIARTL